MLDMTVLQRVLRETTETLARELARPTSVAPDWSEFEWAVARAVAAMHGVSPLLSLNLRWRGPAGWRDFLDEQHRHTAARHLRISSLLVSIDQRTCEAGIGAVALKGVALHSLGLYSPGERPMADIDLLVKPEDADQTRLLLESLGYRAYPPGWKEQVFTPLEDRTPGKLGEHLDNNIKIELHQRICEMLPCRITDMSTQIFPLHSKPGLNGYASLASLMTHVCLHAAGAMAHQGLRLLHLHDLASLAARMTAADWVEFTGGGEEQRLWWAFPPLRLASVYFTQAIPPEVLTALESVCPRWLARMSRRKLLADVSYSYLWVDAFPGIEWTRSLREVLGYIESRVRPDHALLAERKITANTQAWAAGSGWTAMSHGRRMLRWLTSRPARPVTMHSVNAAVTPPP